MLAQQRAQNFGSCLWLMCMNSQGWGSVREVISLAQVGSVRDGAAAERRRSGKDKRDRDEAMVQGWCRLGRENEPDFILSSASYLKAPGVLEWSEHSLAQYAKFK